jgi:hypothetical protein
MHCVSAKFVPCLLINQQKENRVSISQDMLANADAVENLLKNRLDFFVFLTLKGHHFENIKEIKENVMSQLFAIKQNAFQKWKIHWQSVVASGGDSL